LRLDGTLLCVIGWGYFQVAAEDAMTRQLDHGISCPRQSQKYKHRSVSTADLYVLIVAFGICGSARTLVVGPLRAVVLSLALHARML
jgi:hypothetical protein